MPRRKLGRTGRIRARQRRELERIYYESLEDPESIRHADLELETYWQRELYSFC